MLSKNINEKEIIREDFDLIAELPQSQWDNNAYYHKELLKYIPECNYILDIGCGTGEFSRIISKKVQNVTAIDLSPVMIEKAISLSQGINNISYSVSDIFKFQSKDRKYDCIVSIAAMHHLLPDVLPIIKSLLQINGKFIVLDLYKPSTVADYLMSIIASPVSITLRFLHTGRTRPSLEEREAWEKHMKHDNHMTLYQLKELYNNELPGAYVHRHLLWRYSMVWVNKA